MMWPWAIAMAWKWAVFFIVLLLLTIWLAVGWCGIGTRKKDPARRRQLSQKDLDEIEWLKRMNQKMKE
jgi:hypothetical protein